MSLSWRRWFGIDATVRVAAREGYRLVLNLTRDQFATKSQSDRDQIFSESALSVFKFNS